MNAFTKMDRRCFLMGGTVALGLAGSACAAPARRLRVGHTGITWGYKPEDAARAIPDVASLGYQGYETFGEVLDAWKPKGGLKTILDENNLPLISAYCNVNLTDPSKRKDEVEKIVRWSKLILEAGGKVAVIGPNGVKRADFQFPEHRASIVEALNEICRAATDAGVIAALHQHTGTCIETCDEVYSVMEAADTRYVRFGPDIAQLQKGGTDPVPVVRDFLEVLDHVHVKDFNGGNAWDQYCPFGQGQVNLPAVLDLLESNPRLQILMVELDYSRNAPIEPKETARISKDYLIQHGYKFRS